MTESEIIFEAKPGLKNLLIKNGALTIEQYYTETLEEIPSKILSEVQLEALNEIKVLAEKRLGSSVAENLEYDLKKKFFADTADHHGPLTHYFFLNNILIEQIIRKERGLKTILILSCGNIHLENTSFPRGFLRHENGKLQKMALFPSKEKNTLVFTHRPFTEKDIDFIKKKNFTNKEIIENTLHKVLGSKLKTYKDQISLMNYYLFREIYNNPIDLVYLDQESIVVSLIKKYHINKATFIESMIFDKKVLDTYIREFNGITGAFSENTKGSILFWDISEGKKRPLTYDDGLLKTEKGEVINRDRETFLKLLAEEKLLPTMSLCFIVLSFYYGIHCAGGFSQIDYLEKMYTAYKKINKNEKSEVITNIYRGDLIIATQTKNGVVLPATALDILESNTKIDDMVIKKYTQNMTLSEGIHAIFPDLYREISRKGSTMSVNLPSPIIYND